MRSHRYVLLVYALGGLVLGLGCTPTSNVERVVDLGSHQLEIRLAGTGSPAVVMDTGIADDMDRLASLQQRLSAITRVVTYNRAGYGQSTTGPLPRDSKRVADELKALLDHTGISGPYVLVGHSIGALNMQVFAAHYPEEVAGLVLLDPPPRAFIQGEAYAELWDMADQLTRSWQTQADSLANLTMPSSHAEAAFFRMIASEHREMFGASAQQVAAISSFGTLPLTVIAATEPNPMLGDLATDYQRFWIEQSRRLADLSSNGRFVLAEGASHYIYLDAPEVVVRAIERHVSKRAASEGD